MQIVKMLHNEIHELFEYIRCKLLRCFIMKFTNSLRTYIFLAYFYRLFKLKISSRSLKSEEGSNIQLFR